MRSKALAKRHKNPEPITPPNRDHHSLTSRNPGRRTGSIPVVNESSIMILSELIDSLEANKRSDYFSLDIADAVEELEKTDIPRVFIESIIKFMESNPLTDFGTPGSLVKLLERYRGRGYEELLLESLSRSPTTHTIWMLNRLMNGTEDLSFFKEALSVLLNVANDSSLEDYIRESAKEVREQQNERLIEASGNGVGVQLSDQLAG